MSGELRLFTARFSFIFSTNSHITLECNTAGKADIDTCYLATSAET